ncbi:hypothetical protein ON010_g2977 [Phytophthora cinnamomi]|nr:hypothetical protein ON010_g2977 [Phytophthora cinnamomi]
MSRPTRVAGHSEWRAALDSNTVRKKCSRTQNSLRPVSTLGQATSRRLHRDMQRQRHNPFSTERLISAMSEVGDDAGAPRGTPSSPAQLPHTPPSGGSEAGANLGAGTENQGSTGNQKSLEERSKRWEVSLIEMATEKERQEDEKRQSLRDAVLSEISDDVGETKQPSQDQGPSAAEVAAQRLAVKQRSISGSVLSATEALGMPAGSGLPLERSFSASPSPTPPAHWQAPPDHTPDGAFCFVGIPVRMGAHQSQSLRRARSGGRAARRQLAQRAQQQVHGGGAAARLPGGGDGPRGHGAQRRQTRLLLQRGHAGRRRHGLRGLGQGQVPGQKGLPARSIAGGTDDPARAEQGRPEAGGRRRHLVPGDGDPQGVKAVAFDGSHRPTAAGVHTQAATGESEQWQEQLAGGSSGLALLEGITSIQDKLDLIETPYLLQHGTADQACSVSGSAALHLKTRSADKTFKTYEGGHHDLASEPPRIRDAVVRDFVAWLEDHSSTSSKISRREKDCRGEHELKAARLLAVDLAVHSIHQDDSLGHVLVHELASERDVRQAVPDHAAELHEQQQDDDEPVRGPEEGHDDRGDVAQRVEERVEAHVVHTRAQDHGGREGEEAAEHVAAHGAQRALVERELIELVADVVQQAVLLVAVRVARILAARLGLPLVLLVLLDVDVEGLLGRVQQAAGAAGALRGLLALLGGLADALLGLLGGLLDALLRALAGPLQVLLRLLGEVLQLVAGLLALLLQLVHHGLARGIFLATGSNLEVGRKNQL